METRAARKQRELAEKNTEKNNYRCNDTKHFTQTKSVVVLLNRNDVKSWLAEFGNRLNEKETKKLDATENNELRMKRKRDRETITVVTKKFNNAHCNEENSATIQTRGAIQRKHHNAESRGNRLNKKEVKKLDATKFNELVPGMKRKRETVAKIAATEKKEIRCNEKEQIKRRSRKTNLTLKERISHEAPNKEFVLNEIILGTVPGYPPWPARIVDISGQTIKVEFFGTGEINPLRPNAVSRFELNRTIPLLQRKCYKKTMRELEMVLSIPSDVSIFN